MKIPVIRGKIGRWRYYVGAMTFQQVKERVIPSINEIYPSDIISNLLQRELTDNYKSIKEYICRDNERFFNALILAIYNGDPQWLEVGFDGEYEGINNVGFLDLPEGVTIFPVDGQHRVAGIIEAIKEKEELNNEQIPVVFIPHDESPEGIKRTRKLFSTLNRRGKLVAENAQIALDEDDVVAIATRELMVTCPLFLGNRLVNVKNKQIPITNLEAFTSLVTLYQCNALLIKKREKLSGEKFKQYLFYRPSEEDVENITRYLFEFWLLFSSEIDDIREYLSKDQRAAQSFRNENGGNILFRPVVLTEYVKAAIRVADKHGGDYRAAFRVLNGIKTQLSDIPWRGVLWDGRTMVTRANKKLIMLLILKMCGDDYLQQKESSELVEKYKSAINSEADITEIERELNNII